MSLAERPSIDDVRAAGAGLVDQLYTDVASARSATSASAGGS
jgi:hypothetical protein